MRHDYVIVKCVVEINNIDDFVAGLERMTRMKKSNRGWITLTNSSAR
jgi:hypothetical protein